MYVVFNGNIIEVRHALEINEVSYLLSNTRFLHVVMEDQD